MEQGIFQAVIQGGSFGVIVWIFLYMGPKYLARLDTITTDFRSDIKECREEAKEDRDANREALGKMSEAVHDIGSKVILHNEQFHNPRSPGK